MNLIRSSQDWPVLIKLAEKYKLKSSQPMAVFRFVEDLVKAPDHYKEEIFEELLKHLADQERARGEQKVIIIPLGGSNGKREQQGKSKGNDSRGQEGTGEGTRSAEEGT